MNKSTNTVSVKEEIRSGYDLPVYGLANGTFYYIHIPALICILSSLCCAITVLILSFRQRSYKTFFSWAKNERFIVYLAICDGAFNISHSMDHLQYTILKEHVRPKELCELYGFLLAEFVNAQNLMVNIVAINAFTIMYFKKNINFGKRDWKLLCWTFGLPFICVTPAAATELLGPTGLYCYFDGIKGSTANVFYTTVPLIFVLIMNIVMYGLTWKRIRQEISSLNRTLHSKHIVNKSHRAAKNMSMFVLAFFIQWWPLALYGIWALVDANVPQPVFHIVTLFSNIGGCLNLGIFYIIRRRNKRNSMKDSKPGSCEMQNIPCDAETAERSPDEIHM